MDKLADPPADPLQRIAWLTNAQQHLDSMLSEALFDSRMQGRFEEARLVAGLSRKDATARTRTVNEQRGRQVRWNGL